METSEGDATELCVDKRADYYNIVNITPIREYKVR